MSKYQVMPDLTATEYEELKADIAERGVMVAIEFDDEGNIIDGHHRKRACDELGITDYPTVVRGGLTEAQKRLHARRLNLARRHLTQEQKRELVQEQLKDTPEKSDRQIAAELGVSHVTIGTQRKKLLATGQIDQLNKRIGADGKEREQPKLKPSSMTDTEPNKRVVTNETAQAEPQKHQQPSNSENRVCVVCEQEKPIADFFDGKSNTCKECCKLRKAAKEQGVSLKEMHNIIHSYDDIIKDLKDTTKTFSVFDVVFANVTGFKSRVEQFISGLNEDSVKLSADETIRVNDEIKKMIGVLEGFINVTEIASGNN